jgi:hypothetical protein
MGGEQSLGCCVHSVSVAAHVRAVWPTREKEKRKKKKRKGRKNAEFFSKLVVLEKNKYN